MRILLVNQYAGAPRYGMEYRPYYFAREWLRLGHDVIVLGGSYSHLRVRNPQPTPVQQPEDVDGIQMVWFPLPTYQGSGVRRARNILTFAARLISRSGEIAAWFRPNIVITSSTHPLDIYGGERIADLSGATLIHEVHDLWPETLVQLAQMPRWHPFVALLQVAENHAYRRADRVVSILPAAMPYMERHGLDSRRFLYVPNGVAVEDWHSSEPLPAGHAETLDRIRATQFVVGYAGGFALSNDLESFVGSLAHTHRSDIHLVLVGDGEHRRALEARYASERVTFLPPVDKMAIPSLLTRFDVCFLGHKRSPLYRFGVNPNKMFDYMMAGRPIICAIDAPNDPVTDSGAGITIPPQDPRAVANAIDQLASESVDQRRLRGEKGRSYVVEHHSYRNLAKRFISGLTARATR